MAPSLRWVASIAVIGLAAAGGYVVHRPARAPVDRPSTDPGADGEIDALKTRMGQLEQSMAYARRASVESTGHPGGDAPAVGARPDGGLDGARRGPPPSREELAERRARHAARFDAALKEEPRDRSWAPGYESEIRDAVKATVVGGSGPTVETVSCRTSVCRLELAYATQDTQRQFLEAFPVHRPPMTAARWTNNPSSDGTGKLTIDFVREGYPIPGADEATN